MEKEEQLIIINDAIVQAKEKLKSLSNDAHLEIKLCNDEIDFRTEMKHKILKGNTGSIMYILKDMKRLNEEYKSDWN